MPISYELAKKLKDAGFSQEKLEHHNCQNCACRVKDAYVPTLTELIESCGDNFRTLEKGRTDGWYASGNGAGEAGSTPEEAVANLWLELNKK